MVLYYNNQTAIRIAKNPFHHDWTIHVEIDIQFIKKNIEEGVFKVSYTPTNCQLTDIITKAFARVNFEDLTKKLGMINIYNVAWGEVLEIKPYFIVFSKLVQHLL